jgi:aminoglycoside/choline kinase family phosphotransferase
MSSRRISALPRALNSRSLTASRMSASIVVRSASLCSARASVWAAAGPAMASAASVASRKRMKPDTFSLVLEFLMIADARRDALQRWLAPRLGSAFELTPASEDASFRRYFRARLGDGATYVAMDAPPDKEDCRAFVRVARMLAEAGVHAPEVIEQDLEQGFLLLSDLGTRTYLQELKSGDATRLFADAIEALLRWQLATRAGELPPYDEALLRRELNLFPEWYVGRHLRKKLSAAQTETLEKIFRFLVQSALAQPAVYVHRDYMPRNLMVCEPNPGVLDFQDAVLGPITYDMVCLVRDAFISWEEERVLDWSARYWEKAKAARLPVAADFGEFWRAFEWMGLQRHLKVLGIFARIQYRDGKPKYLADTPRFIGYARAVATRYGQLAGLAKLLDEIA